MKNFALLLMCGMLFACSSSEAKIDEKGAYIQSKKDLNFVKNKIAQLKDAWILFPKMGYTFTKEQLKNGVKIEYALKVQSPISKVITIPLDYGQSRQLKSFGLRVQESIFGNEQFFCLSDYGLSPHRKPEDLEKIDLKPGVYNETIEWDGRNWIGPSDFSNPKGDYFPSGTYKLRIRSEGYFDGMVDETHHFYIDQETDLTIL